jgi:hypothetical protein
MSTKQQDLINFYVKRMRGIIGQPSSALDSLLVPSKQAFSASDAYETIKAPEIAAGEKWYPGSISVGGFVYSKVDVRFDFGNYGSYDFSAGFWGGFGGGAGGGGGPWVETALPRDGEEMEFQIAFGALTGGSVELFWWRKNGPIQGGFVGVIGGLGVGGSKGTGKWKKA